MSRVKCEYCGFDLTGIGILGYINHMEIHTEPIVYKVPTDNEMREAFMEIGMPSMIYDAFKYAQPTKMEKKIYRYNSSYGRE